MNLRVSNIKPFLRQPVEEFITFYHLYLILVLNTLQFIIIITRDGESRCNLRSIPYSPRHCES